MHQSMFGVDDEHSIPLSTSLNLSKMSKGGLVTTDTCNSAQKISRLIVHKVKEAAIRDFIATHGAEEVLDKEELLVLRQDCHHHL